MTWGVIIACHLVYRRRVTRGLAPESSFKLPFASQLCWATLVFLTFVAVLLAFDPTQRVALYALPIWAVVLLGGYKVSTSSKRSTRAATEPTYS